LVSFGVRLKPGRKLALCRFGGFSRIIGGGRAFDRPTRQDAAGVDGGGRCEGLCGRLDAPITPTDRLVPFLRLLEIEGEFVERVATMAKELAEGIGRGAPPLASAPTSLANPVSQ
jgi:hypothetical protein